MIRQKAAWACFALTCLSLGVSSWTLSRHFEGGVSQEFCQYLEIGRNLLDGRGFRTAAVYPFTLAFLDERGIPFDADHLAPVLDRFPMQAYLTALSELVLGKTDLAAEALSALLLALCAAATCAVGWSLFGPIEGILGGLFLALNPSFQRGFLLWGLPDFGFCLLTLAAIYYACRRASFHSGAAGGFAWMARSNFVLWLPAFAGAFSHPRRTWIAKSIVFVIAFLAFSAPGWLYNVHWYGAPTPPTLSWNLAHHVVQDSYPILSYRTFSSWDAIAHHSPELWRKFQVYLWWHLRDFPTLWQMQWLFPLMLLGMALTLRRRRPARTFLALTVAMLVLHVLAFSFLRYERLGAFVAGRYLIWWAPAALLFSARGITGLVRLIRLPRATALAAGALAAAWFVPYLAMPQGASAHPSGKPVGAWPELQSAAQAAGKDGLLVTNLPSQAAWYVRVRAIGLPADPQDVLAMEKHHAISAMLVSKLPIGELDQTPDWLPLLSDPHLLRDFAKQAGFHKIDNLDTAVLLRR